MNNQNNGSQVVAAMVILVVLVSGAAFLLPWKNINWGKVQFQNAEVVNVTGEAKTQQTNQIASYTAGVDSVKDSKSDAVAEVNKKVAAIIDAAKTFGIPASDIKTQNISIYQNEETYYDNGVQKSRKGQWRVNNSVEITLRKIDKASELADLLTSSGATNVYGPNFRLDDTSATEKGLFDQAMKDARDKAEIIAKASGRNLGKVVNVTVGGATNNVFPMYAKEGMGGGGAPVEAGSGTVSTSINVTFELE
ncbi:MAG TPA: SIMPL domain-containing protein [Patescibacteria group bacterium]